MLSAGAHFEVEPHLIAKAPSHDSWMAFFCDSEEDCAGLDV